MSFLDSIDRFAHAAKHAGQIFTAASKRRPTPFADAVLKTPLGDLARDVDPSELGLFTLVPDPSSTPAVVPDDSAALVANAAQKSNVARVEFPGATPLRRPAGMAKHARRENDKEPEVYAKAALKYLHRYQSIRPMPRARQEVEAIISRLNELRLEIVQLSGLPEVESKEEAPLTEKIKNEEKRIHELTMRIKHMKARKEALTGNQRPSPANGPAVPVSKKTEEDDFWGSPSSAPAQIPRSRGARKSLLISNLARGALGPDDSLLLDSKINVNDGAMLEDVTMGSLIAPTPKAPAPLPEPPSFVDQTDATMEAVEMTPTPAPQSAPQVFGRPVALNLNRTPAGAELDVETANDVEMEEEDNEVDQTAILTGPPPSRKRTPPPSSPPEHKRMKTDTPPSLPDPAPTTATTQGVFKVPITPKSAATPSRAQATPGTARKDRVRITLDVERIIAKMWATVGDIIMPGHPFNTASAASSNKPPQAKETIALLENLSRQTPSFAASPSQTHSSLSLTGTVPTPALSTHVILTTHFLLALLKATPKYSMPLAQAKAVLADANMAIARLSYTEEELALGMGSDKALETRALYGCVAKRLVKIDRGGGEQIVRFEY